MYRHFQHLTLKFLSCAFLYREEEEDPSTQHPLENRWKQWRQTVCRTDVATSPDSKPATCIQNTNKKNLINSSPVLFFLYIFLFYSWGKGKSTRHTKIIKCDVGLLVLSVREQQVESRPTSLIFCAIKMLVPPQYHKK